jgi:CHASE1-domain containing sensor protein/tRNA A-37 threonylcarbamoyl transferase component Bud32
LFGASRGRERYQKRQEFVQRAQQLAFSIETHFEVPLELLGSVAALFVSSEDVSRAEFETFVRPIIERHPSIYAFEWMPLLAHDDRDHFVRTVRAEGFSQFHVQQRDPRGELMPSRAREDYLPILYMEPLEPAVLGLDVIGNPERGDESHRARNLRRSTASDRYSLIEDPDDVFSVIAYEPVLKGQDDAFVGLVGVLLRLEPVVRQAISSGGTEGFHISLRDESAPEGKQLLFESPAHAEGLDFEASWTREFEFADRLYSVALTPLPGSVWTLNHGPVVLWGAGILLGVLAAFGSGALLQIGRLRKRVDEAMELGQYRLGHLLGEGGMGVVYQAEHRMLARPAAIKLIRPEATGDRGEAHQRFRLEQFEREAKATAALHSPHTIQVYDFGHTDRDEFYYVMELLDGLDLETLIQNEGPVDPARVVHILRQVCHSLAEAHSVGLVHRDIKPANIYLCRHGLEYDFVKVLDFGLVRTEKPLTQEGSTLQKPGSFAGTPAFCSPEMATTGGDVDGRSDLYSLGCVAYWLLTGRNVFEGRTSVAIVVAHVGDAPIPPSTVSEIDIPPDLESIVLWCLEKRPDDRPQTAEELSLRLDACTNASDWTAARAQHWWLTHRPEGIPTS